MSLKCGCQDVHQTTTTTKQPDENSQTADSLKLRGAKGEISHSQRCNTKTCTSQCIRPSTTKSSLGDSTAKSKSTAPVCSCSATARFFDDACSKQPIPKNPLCKCIARSPERELQIEKDRRLQLETELDRLKLQIADMMQSKCMALNMTKQLKQRYEKMKGVHEDTSSRMATLQRENELLSRSLERERMEKAKTESSVQVTKDMDRIAIRRMRLQAAKIKTLNDSVLSLSKTVEDKEFEKKRLEHEKDKIHEKLKKNKDVTRRLSQTTAKLAKSVKQKHDSFMAIRNKASKYERELGSYKEEVRRSQQELERLRTEVERQKSKGDSLSSTPKLNKADAELEEKLKKTKLKERRASETIQLLSQKIRDLEHKDPKALEKELQRVNKELKTMQQKYEDAAYKLKELEEADKERSEQIRNEMAAFAEDLLAKETIYLDEKEKLKQLIEELQSIIEEQRKRIADLESAKEQQDIVIRSQIEQLNSKEEQIKLREQENDLVKEQCLDLDKQVDNLRTSIDEFEQIGVKSTHIELRERINALSDEVDNLKSTLRNEQKKSDTKDQIIENQHNQIEDLKTKLLQTHKDFDKMANDSNLQAKASQEQLHRVGRQLAKEKQYTKQAVSQLTAIQKQKMALEKDVSELEESYQEMSQGSINKTRGKEDREWIEEKKKLTQERDRAIDAAKLATKTLMETMDDFQGQIKSQQKLQKIVAEIISTKSNPKIPPCIKRKEIDRLKQLQIALPRPSPRPCRKVCYSFLNNEDEYYTAESGKYSGQSDSDESLGVCNILQMLGKCNNCSTRTNRPDTAPSYSQLCQLPSTSAPTSTQSHDNCRCVNVQTLTCQCAKSIPTPKNNERQKFLQCTKKQRP
ncbi:hypothetical protein QE152_g9070 [Popillia japonica]|uniref:Uncharacterized protein n=1 Tax=Popillia japonica TaxID=7064 RepID=A0AAW1M0I5_POPJA